MPDSVQLCRGFINENDTAEFIGYSGNEGIYVKLFDNGQYESIIFPAPEGKRLVFDNLIPLNNEGYFISGTIYDVGDSNFGALVIKVLDKNFNVIQEQTIFVLEGYIGFKGGAAVEDDDGTIVLLESVRRENPSMPGSYENRGVLFRFSQDGDCLNSRYLIAEPPDPICYMQSVSYQYLVNDPFNNLLVAMCPGQGGVQSLLYFDYDFNLVDNYLIEDPTISEWNGSRYVSSFYSDYWYNENEFLIVATQQDNTGSNHPHVLMGRTNREGQIIEKNEITKQDTLMYSGQMACANDSTIYVLAKCNTDNWLTPYYPQIYLINKDLEILGCFSLWNHLNYSPILAFATQDEGCTVIVSRSIVFSETPLPCAIHFTREDFHPVWSIKEKPKQDILSFVYPNPATDEIHFDLTDMPTNGSVRLRIANINGHTFIDRIIRGSGNLLTVGIETLPPGVYTYCLYTKDKIMANEKFVKE